MVSPSAQEIKESIEGFLQGADLAQLSSKKVRKQLEQKFDCDLTDRKQEIDGILMAVLNADEEKKAKENSSNGCAEQNGDAGDDSGASDSAGSSDDEGVDDSEPVKKRKKTKSSSDDNSAADDEEMARQLQQDERGMRQRKGKKAAAPKKRKAAGSSEGRPKDAKARGGQNPLAHNKGAESSEVKKFRGFGMMKLLKDHMVDPLKME